MDRRRLLHGDGGGLRTLLCDPAGRTGHRMTTTLYIIIGVTVVALIVLLVVFFIQKRKAKRAAALEDGSQAPGGDDISVLIHEAEAKMAAAKIGRSKVGTVPVYVIAGEPGTTKTSVMLHC